MWRTPPVGSGDPQVTTYCNIRGTGVLFNTWEVEHTAPSRLSLTYLIPDTQLTAPYSHRVFITIIPHHFKASTFYHSDE